MGDDMTFQVISDRLRKAVKGYSRGRKRAVGSLALQDVILSGGNQCLASAYSAFSEPYDCEDNFLPIALLSFLPAWERLVAGKAEDATPEEMLAWALFEWTIVLAGKEAFSSHRFLDSHKREDTIFYGLSPTCIYKHVTKSECQSIQDFLKRRLMRLAAGDIPWYKDLTDEIARGYVYWVTIEELVLCLEIAEARIQTGAPLPQC